MKSRNKCQARDERNRHKLTKRIDPDLKRVPQIHKPVQTTPSRPRINHLAFTQQRNPVKYFKRVRARGVDGENDRTASPSKLGKGKEEEIGRKGV